MRLVIVESPYAGATPLVVERHLRYLRACLADCLARGEAPFASHGLYTQPGVLDDHLPEQRELGIEAGFAWRPQADATVVYGDLGQSTGMTRGIRDAELVINVGVPHVIEHRLLGPGWESRASIGRSTWRNRSTRYWTGDR